MINGIIENAEELKSLFFRTDLTNIASVQAAAKEISENVYVTGKEKYLVALNAATPANLSKARKYNKIVSAGGIKSLIMKNLGWIIMALFAIWMVCQDWDADSTWQSLGFWIGVAIQIYIGVLKSAWNKLTLSGLAIHPALKTLTKAHSPVNTSSPSHATPPIATKREETDNAVFCSVCGQKNKEMAKFCSNCGKTLI